LKSNQSHSKSNISTYNFYVYTETPFKTENGEKVKFSQVVWQKSRADFIEPEPRKIAQNWGTILAFRGPILG